MINDECHYLKRIMCRWQTAENSNEAKAFRFSAPAFCCGSPTQAALNCKNVSILNDSGEAEQYLLMHLTGASGRSCWI